MTTALRVETSFAQQSLWLLDQADPGQPTYNVLAAVRMRGRLDAPALHRALNTVVDRHEALRTVFAFDGYEPLQVILPRLTVPLPVTPVSLSDVDELIRQEIERPFDLAGGPLLRMRLLRLGAEDHIAVLVMHHIITDGFSSAVLFRELSGGYEAYADGAEPDLPDLPIQYADFAVWQRDALSGEALAELLDYWTDRLSGVTPLLLPADRARPVQASAAGDTYAFPLPAATVARLDKLARDHSATPFMVYLAAFMALLGRYADRDDLTVATPVAGRTRPETAGLIGFFINTLVLRGDLSGDPSFVELLGRVRDVCLGAYAHADLPYEKLVDELRPARYTGNGGPLAQVMFSLQNFTMEPWRAGDLVFEAMNVATRTAKFDLSLELTPQDGGHRAVLEYSTELFERVTIERFAALYAALLEEVAADQYRPMSRLRLLDEATRDTLIRSDVDGLERIGCLHELFAAQAAATPDATAVVCGPRRLTYAELDRRANHLAHRLRGAGVTDGEPVAVLLPRGEQLVVALLAVLKSGACYLPLDAVYPDERIAFMVADSGARYALSTVDLSPRLPVDGVLLVDDDRKVDMVDGGLANDPPPSRVTADDPAYLIYTSGSTGTPKGARNTHRGVAAFALAFARTLGVTPADRALQLAPVGFDVVAEELYPYLLTGGSVAIPDGEPPIAPADLWALAAETGATTLSTTPSRLTSWTASDRAGMPSTLRRIIFGSEGAPALGALVAWREWSGELWQVYGVTEAGCTSVVGRVDFGGDPDLVVPLGRPLPHCRALVLDRWLEPVPPGVAGELYLGGPSVADGYPGRPALTAERFLPDPYGPPGARLYRTGDLVRTTVDGALTFVGRTDHQVKIRGFRVEPGEVEAVLAGDPSLTACVVLARPDKKGRMCLIAYAVPSTMEVTAATLRRYAADRLPDWMVPADYVLLDALPTTANGKLDRAALASLDADSSAATAEYVAPETAIECELADIWAQVLDRTRIGTADSFFALGGNSLLAVQMLSQVRDRLGVELPMRLLFTGEPTVAELAGRIASADPDSAAPTGGVVPVARPDGEQVFRTSAIERLMWFLHQEYPGESTFTTLGALRMLGRLDLAVLTRAFNELLRRHDVMRSVYRLEDGEVLRIEPPYAERAIPVQDVSDDDVDVAGAAVIDEPFDLTTGPLVRLKLLRRNADDHVAVLVLHHIVSDGRSMELFFHELATLYVAYLAGISEPLPPLAVQYADVAAWQDDRIAALRGPQSAYWADRLAGHELVRLPTDLRPPDDLAPPAQPSSAGLTYGLKIPDHVATGLRELGAAHQATLFMVTLAAHHALLAWYSGQRDFVVATPVSWRDRPEIDALVGAFINYVPLRADLSGNLTFAELVDVVRDQTALDLQNHDLPYDEVCALAGYEPTQGRHALLRVLFTEEADPSVPPTGSDALRAELVEPPWHHALRDFTTRFTAAEDGTYIIHTYRTDAFTADRIAAIAEDYRDVLARVVAEPHRRVFEAEGPFGVALRVPSVNHEGAVS